MKIEIRAIKYAAFASQETSCFTATIYIDGKRVGTAHNEGHGGQTSINPQECKAQLEAHAKTLPRIVTEYENADDPSGFLTYQPSAESVIDELLHVYLCEQDDKKLLKTLEKRILFTRQGSPAITRCLPRQPRTSSQTPLRLLSLRCGIMSRFC